MGTSTLSLGGAQSLIRIEAGLLERVGTIVAELAPASRPLVVSDETVWSALGNRFDAARCSSDAPWPVVKLPPGESTKSLTAATELYGRLAKEHLGRDGVIVAFGGGVVSDLAGFVSGTWMRGVRWIIVPTTLEAQIDAAIGGKTAVNLPEGKNLVGVFHPPMAVIIDPTCLATLPRREFVAGLAESVKHALITSEEFLAWHEQNAERILALDDATTRALIERNVAIKAAIVERDPREQTGQRLMLNFGHTVGHAIEACSLSRATCGNREDVLRHGECVAMGMVVACRLSQRLGMLEATVAQRVERVLTRLGLPVRIPQAMTADQLLAAMVLDKKVRGGHVQLVLLEGIGRPCVRGDVSLELLRRELSPALGPLVT